MTHALVTCPVGPLGRTECAQLLIDASQLRRLYGGGS